MHIFSDVTHYLIFHRYDSLLISVIVLVAYTGWIALLGTYVFPSTPAADNKASLISFHALAMVILAASWTFFLLQRSPGAYYVYAIFPCYFWDRVFSRVDIHGWQITLRRQEAGITKKLGMNICLTLLALMSMVVRLFRTCVCLAAHFYLATVRIHSSMGLECRTSAYGADMAALLAA